MHDQRCFYRVDMFCEGKLNRGLFYASHEDSALSFCLHYTGIKKLSDQPEWKLAIYEVLMDDVELSQETLMAAFDQDGYVVPLPEVDLAALKSTIQHLIDMHGSTD